MSNKARIKELREKQAREHEAAKAEFDKITPDMGEGERKAAEERFDKAMDVYDRYEADIERLQRLDDADARAREREDKDDLEARNKRRPDNGGSGARGDGDPEKAPEMRSVFNKLLRHRSRDALTPEELAVYEDFERGSFGIDPEERALASGTGSAGGYTVPTIFRDTIEKTLAAWGPMLDGNVIDLMKTDSGATMEWPTVNDTASRGELVAENAAATDDGGNDLAFGQASLSAYMYSSEIMRIPLQLLRDSAFDFETRLVPDLFGERMARTANNVLTVGDGSSKPQGIVTGAGAGNTATSTTAIADDELIDLQHAVNPAYRNNPNVGFMFNDNVLKAVRKLKDANDRYIWQRPDMETGAPATLLDKRYWINQAMVDPAAGTVPVIFGDMKKYIVRMVGDWELFFYREMFMNKKQIGVESFGRLDGLVVNNAAIKKLTMAAS